MSDLLPLFPLPNVVLFPNVFLALHVFEPRYTEMVADALTSDRMIGMVLLRPGWETEYEGRPPVYEIGCSGVITHVEKHRDGRYNIVLRGLDKFRILAEDHGRSYRRASVDLLPEPAPSADERAAIHQQRSRLGALLSPGSDGGAAETRTPAAMSDDDLVNALAQYLDFEPLEKQALLERPCLRARAASLVELLEMKIITARTPGPSNLAH
ncbi:MAG: LON peptidase substrate-binding domain-containing protein [Acidobacteria bacterium]|nr:LON peptidase substrate-binding domain-containing protein [Acidobacteriota bacterium]